MTLGSQVAEDAFTDRRKTEGQQAYRLTAPLAMSRKQTTTTIIGIPPLMPTQNIKKAGSTQSTKTVLSNE